MLLEGVSWYLRPSGWLSPDFRRTGENAAEGSSYPMGVLWTGHELRGGVVRRRRVERRGSLFTLFSLCVRVGDCNGLISGANVESL
jgi:hypothetical protein